MVGRAGSVAGQVRSDRWNSVQVISTPVHGVCLHWDGKAGEVSEAYVCSWVGFLVVVILVGFD